MSKHLIVIVLLFVAYVLYQEQRFNRLEDSVQQVSGDVQAIKEAIIPGTNVKYTAEDEYCLAKNIFHEAGVESHKGKLAVGQVTVNRVKTGRWGKTICDVVYAKAQFSWTLDKNLVREEPKGQLWAASLKAANEIFAGKKLKQLEHATYYHTDYIKTPFWADKKAKIAQLGQHIFYSNAKVKITKKKMASHLKGRSV